MSGLPREILKWMQSLDLSYSVKNVKRDFANGFLVAEILSRYYKSDITMHSFDNGIGLVKRIQNWALLEKFFRKFNFPIERQLIDEVIHCKSGAAIPFMEQLYTLLTHKMIQTSRPVKDTDLIPPFARPTASALIKERMYQPDLIQTSTLGALDQTLAPAKAEQVLAQHIQQMKLERVLDPQRFQPKHSTPSRIRTGAGPTSPNAQPVHFKEVQVRQVDDPNGVLQLRANYAYHQQQQAAAAYNQPQQPSTSSSTTAAPPAPTSPSQQQQQQQQPPLPVMTPEIWASLSPQQQYEYQQIMAMQQQQQFYQSIYPPDQLPPQQPVDPSTAAAYPPHHLQQHPQHPYPQEYSLQQYPPPQPHHPQQLTEEQYQQHLHYQQQMQQLEQQHHEMQLQHQQQYAAEVHQQEEQKEQL